ncbi:MAG: ABC transporter substrate-binding protein [Anaerolineales bacterium]|nr:ABC transporter substrate-binding protein [Anaerolineales bacterium]
MTLQLKWVHQAQFAGFYTAQEQGHYSREGLKVNFVEGGPNIDLIQQVLDGKADFGVAAPEQILAAVERGEPVKAVAVIYRLNPMVFIAHADTGIERPHEIPGHSIAILGSHADTQFLALLKNYDIDPEEVEWRAYEYNLQTFLDREVDLTIGYMTGNLIRLRQEDVDVNIIWPGDYGIHFYADTLFTTDELISSDPDLVRRFVHASLTGWRVAIEDPASALETVMRYAQNPDRELQSQMLEASIPMVYTGEAPIGWMEATKWTGMYTMLEEHGFLNESFDPDTAYTLEFLETIYSGE